MEQKDSLTVFTPEEISRLATLKLDLEVYEKAGRLLNSIKADYEKAGRSGDVSYILSYGYPMSSSFYVDAKLSPEAQWSKFDQEMNLINPDQNGSRLVVLHNLGFLIPNIPPYPVIEPDWQVVEVKNAEFSYIPCPKGELEGIYLVRSRKPRQKGRKMVLNENLIWAPDAQALVQFLTKPV